MAKVAFGKWRKDPDDVIMETLAGGGDFRRSLPPHALHLILRDRIPGGIETLIRGDPKQRDVGVSGRRTRMRFLPTAFPKL